MPPLLKARAALAVAECDVADAASLKRRARAFVRARNVGALSQPIKEWSTMDVSRDVIDIVTICHEEENERRALTRVCEAVRERVGAAAVAMFAAGPDGGSLASSGGDMSGLTAIARRASDTNLTIVPSGAGQDREAATPVRYSGRTLAALSCCWAVDARCSPDSAAAVLRAAAAACAPCVSAVVDGPGSTRPLRDSDLGLIGPSDALEGVRRGIRRAAQVPFPVLIEGESGSGKELVARAIHQLGPRSHEAFCPVNCAALTDELLEAELFGHARGAFTGAIGERAGLFEEADKGVLLLDEVGELSARGQAKLLRAIQEGEIRRIGENLARRVDVRIIAATNRSIASEVESGRFRRDLWYRLDVIRIVIPPLREHVEDVAALAAHWWTVAARQVGSRASLDPAVLGVLARYDWPGNVRELQNVMTALAVSAPRRGHARVSDLPTALCDGATPAGSRLDHARRTFERRHVRDALARAGGRRSRAAMELGVSRQGLAKLMKRLELE